MLADWKEESVKGLLEWRGGVDGKGIYEGILPWEM